jgi:two-component SAPR family response regulator
LELLKALIAKGDSKVSLSHLADALWPDADGDDARNSLKTTIHRLRRLLNIPEALRLSNGFLSLQQKYCWCDTQVVAALAATPRSNSERLANLKRALELCRGTLLEYEEESPWILASRKRMQRIAHAVVMELGVHYEAKCKWNKAIAAYNKGLHTDPTDEQVYRHLMLCYQRIGQQNEAIAAYERCCDELKLQLDRVPTSRTLALAESIIQT